MDATADPKDPNQVATVMAALRKIESSGNYTVVNSYGAKGAYQFLDPTWHGLTAKYNLGQQYATADQAPPAIQDQIARLYITDILSQHNGSVAAVANAWNPKAGSAYVDSVIAAFSTSTYNNDPNIQGGGVENGGTQAEAFPGSATLKVPGISSVTDFLGKLASPTLWKRVGLGALGVGLIVLVIAKSDTASKVGKAATSTAKVAAL